MAQQLIWVDQAAQSIGYQLELASAAFVCHPSSPHSIIADNPSPTPRLLDNSQSRKVPTSNKSIGPIIRQHRQLTVDLASTLLRHSALRRTAAAHAIDLARLKHAHADATAAAATAAQVLRERRFDVYIFDYRCACHRDFFIEMAGSLKVEGQTKAKIEAAQKEVVQAEKELKEEDVVVSELRRAVRTVEKKCEALDKAIAHGRYDLVEIAAKAGGSGDWRQR